MRSLQGKWSYQSFCAMPAIADRSSPPKDIQGAAVPQFPRPIPTPKHDLPFGSPLASPKIIRPASLSAPWTPSCVMDLSTASDGTISGSAKLGFIEFRISGTITAAVDSIPERAAPALPEGLDLVVTAPSTGSVYHLRGFFVVGSTHVVGTVVAVSNDLGLQPVGTSGPFVLFPSN